MDDAVVSPAIPSRRSWPQLLLLTSGPLALGALWWWQEHMRRNVADTVVVGAVFLPGVLACAWACWQRDWGRVALAVLVLFTLALASRLEIWNPHPHGHSLWELWDGEHRH